MEIALPSKALQKSSFLISLLIHIFLLLGFSIVLLSRSQPEKKPALDLQQSVPSYVMPDIPKPVTRPHKAQKQIPTDKNGIEKPVPKAANSESRQQAAPKPKKVVTTKNEQPVHLIGEKNVDKPLIKLLGKAIGARLVYPKIAVDFALKGVVYVGFTLDPDGRITGAQVVKSSHAGVLDDAAVMAVATIGTINNVGQYLSEPRFMVVGIIFG